MELALPNPLSNLLLLLLRSVQKDMSGFLSVVYSIISTGWVDSDGDNNDDDDVVSRESEASDNDLDCDQDHCMFNIGKLSISEMNAVMNGLGLVSDDHVWEVEGCPDAFTTLFEEEEPSFGELHEAFRLFDMNRDGYIDALELQRVVRQFGFKGIGLEEVQEMIRAFDGDSDGLIDFADFVKLMERCLC